QVVTTFATDAWQRAYTSPATWRVPCDEITPFDTTSPTTFIVPPEVTEIATPDVPSHPAWSSAAIVGAKNRLLTPLEAVAVRRGEAPLVRIRAKASTSGRVAEMANWL